MLPVHGDIVQECGILYDKTTRQSKGVEFSRP